MTEKSLASARQLLLAVRRTVPVSEEGYVDLLCDFASELQEVRR